MPRHSADDIRRMLADNAKLTARSQASGDTIHKAAGEELARVEERLSALTPGQVFTNEVNAAEYRHLIEDRARLHQLIGRGTRS